MAWGRVERGGQGIPCCAAKGQVEVEKSREEMASGTCQRDPCEQEKRVEKREGGRREERRRRGRRLLIPCCGRPVHASEQGGRDGGDKMDMQRVQLRQRGGESLCWRMRQAGEWVAGGRPRHERLRLSPPSLATADPDASGQLTRAKLRAVLEDGDLGLTRHEINLLMATTDDDGNGLISWEEFSTHTYEALVDAFSAQLLGLPRSPEEVLDILTQAARLRDPDQTSAECAAVSFSRAHLSSRRGGKREHINKRRHNSCKTCSVRVASHCIAHMVRSWRTPSPGQSLHLAPTLQWLPVAGRATERTDVSRPRTDASPDRRACLVSVSGCPAGGVRAVAAPHHAYHLLHHPRR